MEARGIRQQRDVVEAHWKCLRGDAKRLPANCARRIIHAVTFVCVGEWKSAERVVRAPLA